MAPIEKIVASPVEHFTGARLTRRTWGAQLVRADGSSTKCGHYMHPTPEAAIKCGRAAHKREGRVTV